MTRRMDMIGPALVIVAGFIGLATVLVLALAAVAALFCTPAHAEDTYRWVTYHGADSTIRLQPSVAPGAVAEVEFVNRTVHADQDITFALDLGDMVVTIAASVGRGATPDRITVTPPDGFVAVPEVLDVAEEATGRVLILPWVGM